MLSGIVRLYFCFVNYLYFNSLSIVNSRYTFMFIFLFIYLTFCNKTEVKLLATTVKCRCVSSLPQHVVKQHASRTKKQPTNRIHLRQLFILTYFVFRRFFYFAVVVVVVYAKMTSLLLIIVFYLFSFRCSNARNLNLLFIFYLLFFRQSSKKIYFEIKKNTNLQKQYTVLFLSFLTILFNLISYLLNDLLNHTKKRKVFVYVVIRRQNN